MLVMQPANWNNNAALILPSDRRHSNATARRVSRLKLRCPASLIRWLQAGMADRALDAKAILLASFEVLLHRFSGQDEVTVLAVIPADDCPCPAFGHIAVAPVRIDFAGDPDFASVAQQAATAIRDYAADTGLQTVPGGKFPAAFIYHGREGKMPSFALDDSEHLPSSTDLVDADLTLIVHERPDGLQMGFDYDQDLFSSAMIQEIAAAHETLLEAIADEPQQPVSMLNLLGEPQRERFLVSWNDTRVDFDRATHVEQLFDRQADRAPDNVAIRYQQASMTYAELRIRSNQLARHLQALGIGPGKLVAICTDRSPDMVVGLLGILKAGAAYVPLDPHYPADRLAFMLSDAESAALVTQSHWQSGLPNADVPVVRLDADRAAIDSQPADDLEATAGPEDLAYVIYTSGSTGKPKGVAVRRCALTNFIHAMQRQLEVNEKDVFLGLTTISFDIAGLELFLPLAIGGRVVLATRDDACEPAQLAQLVDREQATVMQATPATWRLLLDWHWVGRGNLRILCGGEAMTGDLAERLLRKGSAVWNMYGPTETTIWSTMCRIDNARGPISVGRPIDNTEIYILDRHLKPVPVGAVGELLIGGVGLARGYRNRPELTAEKFIRNPFSEDPQARIYRTGDLARYWPDGRIECLGRIDHQVKIRGFRIELLEIEAHLSAHPAVQQTAVVARDHATGDKYLAAYWSAQEPGECTVSTDDLRAFLAETLPPHMVPSVFVRMGRLPLTPNGKIDRRALPAPDRDSCEHEKSYVAPRNAMERQLVEIWENLLEVRRIGVCDDFFSLGGHSLTAARLVAKVEAATGISMPVSSLLSAPTVERLSRILTGEVQRETGVLVPFRQTGTRPPLFMVAGVGGHVLIFRELAERLGEDQPVYGVEGIGLDGKEAPLNSMEDIARRYIREIRSVQPKGPYFIAGWSMGGVIAYEVAVQLLAENSPLGAVTIIDAYAPWVVPWTDRMRIHLASFRTRSWRSKLEYVAQRVTHQVEVIRRRLGMDHLAENLDGNTAQRVRESSLAQFEALRRYRPKPLAADVYLLRADQTAESRDPRAQHPDLGWRTLVRGQIHILPIPGTHTGIFAGDNVRALAGALGQCMAMTTKSGWAFLSLAVNVFIDLGL